MLDRLIIRHVEMQDEIEDNANEAVEKMIKKIDIDKLIDDPETELSRVADEIKQEILDEHAPEAIKNGVAIGKEIESLKRTIKIPKTKDPKLNEGEVDIEPEIGNKGKD